MVLRDSLFEALIRFYVDTPTRNISSISYLNPSENVQATFDFETIPEKNSEQLRVLIVSDTHDKHNFLRDLPPCDIFIHCGDILMTSRFFSNSSSIDKLVGFNNWLGTIRSRFNIIIAGNHDKALQKLGSEHVQKILTNAKYLENETVIFEEIRIWGTPLSEKKVKSGNRAFQSERFHAETLRKMPDGADIVVSHGRCMDVVSAISPAVHIWGHSHSSHGIRYPGEMYKNHPMSCLSICAPIMDSKFRFTNLPIMIDLPKEQSSLNQIKQIKLDDRPAALGEHLTKRKKSQKFRIFRPKKVYPGHS